MSLRPTHFLALVGVSAFMFAAPPALAQCAGFTDIAPGALCGNVTWMKNRQITLGCTATTYCPNDPVTRLHMALFMNRLGNVLVPTVLNREETGASLVLGPGSPVCETIRLPAVAYPRNLHTNVTLSFDLVGGSQEVAIGLAISTDGAAYVPLAATTAFGGIGGRHHHHNALPVTQPLDANHEYRFAVFVARSGTNFNSIGTWSCQLQAVVYGATG